MKPTQVHRWLDSSQQNIPYDLDFYTPFKKMAMLPRLQDKGRGKGDIKPKLLSGSPSSASSSSSPSSSSPPHTEQVTSSTRYTVTSRFSPKLCESYSKRPRHKTKADHYEYKGFKGRKNNRKQIQEPKRRISRYRSGKTKVQGGSNYHAPNVSTSRLTIKTTGGFLKDGRTSAPIKAPAMEDLSFPEKAFLNLSRKWAAENAQNRSLEEEEEEESGRDRARRKRKRIEEEARMSKYFQPHCYKVLNNKTLRTCKQSPVFVYETPCRQTKRSDGGSTEASIGIDLPAKPFLGFGKPGPEARHQSISTIVGPSPNDSLVEQDVTVDDKLRQNALYIRGEQDIISGSVLSTPLSTDPRFQHSVTSNFKFVRKQSRIPGRFKRLALSKVTKEPIVEKQDEILKLLRNLQQQQQTPKQILVDRTTNTATAQTQTNPERETYKDQAKVSSPILQKPGDNLQNGDGDLQGNQHRHVEDSNQVCPEGEEFAILIDHQNGEAESVLCTQSTNEKVKDSGRDCNASLSNDCGIGVSISPARSSLDAYDDFNRILPHTYSMPTSEHKPSRMMSRRHITRARSFRNCSSGLAYKPLLTPLSMYSVPVPRLRSYTSHSGLGSPPLHEFSEFRTSEIPYTEPISGNTWIRASVHSSETTISRRVGYPNLFVRPRTDCDSLTAISDCTGHTNDLDRGDQIQLASEMSGNSAANRSFNEGSEYDSFLDLFEDEPPSVTAQHENISHFWTPNLLY